MKSAPDQREHPGSPKERKQDWEWKPSSGEGSAAALSKLKRVERVKSSWRRVRSVPPRPPGDDESGDA